MSQEKLTKEHIQLKLETDIRWLERAVVAIWEFQTEQEKSYQSTLEFNGVGFNGSDAPFLTSIANHLNKGRHLTEKQIPYVRKKMKKYAGQLLRIANAKAVAKAQREENQSNYQLKINY